MLKNGNVTLMVSDMDRAIRFYRDTLGLALTFRAGNEWAQLSGAGMTIGLHPRRRAGGRVVAGDDISLGFEVDHLNQAMDELRGKGVEFAPEIQESPGIRIAYFTDPDATPLYLIQTMRSGGPDGWN